MSMLGTVIRAEWRSLVRERAVFWTLGLFAVLVAYAAISGGFQVASEQRRIAAARAEETRKLEEFRASLESVERGVAAPARVDPTNPFLVGKELAPQVAALAPGPLGSVAVGQRDVVPWLVHVTTESRQVTGAGEPDLGSPTRRAAGQFDLAFVFVFLLPLVIIALTYDLIAGERERGTLALVLSQPVSLATFVLGKALQRAGVLLAVVLGLAALALVQAGPALLEPGAPIRALLYFALLAAYAAFWFAAAVAVNVVGRTSAGNALALTGLWLLLVVVVPGLASVYVEARHPPPSRIELVNVARAATAEAEGEKSALEGDHGGQDSYEETLHRQVEIATELEGKVQPLMDAFARQLAEQQRLVERLRVLSPAIVLHEGLVDVAGGGVHRHQHFTAQVDRFHAAWRTFFFSRVLSNTRLTSTDRAAMPRFAYEEEPVGNVVARVVPGLVGMVLPALLLLALALLRLRRPVDVHP